MSNKLREALKEISEVVLRYNKEYGDNPAANHCRNIAIEALAKAALKEDGWIDAAEFEKIVMERLGEKPVIKLLAESGTPFREWNENIYRLIHKELGSKSEVRYSVPPTNQGNRGIINSSIKK